MSAVFISLSGLDYLDSRHRIFPIRLNLEPQVIDHLATSGKRHRIGIAMRLQLGETVRSGLRVLTVLRDSPIDFKPSS